MHGTNVKNVALYVYSLGNRSCFLFKVFSRRTQHEVFFFLNFVTGFICSSQLHNKTEIHLQVAFVTKNITHFEPQRPHRRFCVWNSMETVVGCSSFSLHFLSSQTSLGHTNNHCVDHFHVTTIQKIFSNSSSMRLQFETDYRSPLLLTEEVSKIPTFSTCWRKMLHHSR